MPNSEPSFEVCPATSGGGLIVSQAHAQRHNMDSSRPFKRPSLDNIANVMQKLQGKCPSFTPSSLALWAAVSSSPPPSPSPGVVLIPGFGGVPGQPSRQVALTWGAGMGCYSLLVPRSERHAD